MTGRVVRRDEPSIYLTMIREKPVVGEVLKNFMYLNKYDLSFKCCRRSSKVTEVISVEEGVYKVKTEDGSIYIAQLI